MTRKADWAQAKVDAVFQRNGGLLSGDDLVRLLRHERRRAVRACRNLMKMPAVISTRRSSRYEDIYREACSDCYKAIVGGK